MSGLVPGIEEDPPVPLLRSVPGLDGSTVNLGFLIEGILFGLPIIKKLGNVQIEKQHTASNELCKNMMK